MQMEQRMGEIDPKVVSYMGTLRQKRIHSGIKGTELASLMGMHKGQLWRLESGTTDPRLSTVLRYQNALKALMEQ